MGLLVVLDFDFDLVVLLLQVACLMFVGNDVLMC